MNKSNFASKTTTTTDSNVIANAYAGWALEMVAGGRRATLLTFIFNAIGGSPATQRETMVREVERVYSHTLTRMFRYPNADKNLELLPIWIVAPDHPVPKRGFDRDHFANVAPNDGEHLHALVLEHRSPRMQEGFASYLEDREGQFAGTGKLLQRLHVRAVDTDPDYVAAYALKSLTRHRIDAGDVFVLPRNRSELSRAM